MPRLQACWWSVEVEGIAVEGAGDPVVVVAPLAAWCGAPEHAVAATARATRANPVVLRPFITERVDFRGWPETSGGAGRRCRRRGIP